MIVRKKPYMSIHYTEQAKNFDFEVLIHVAIVHVLAMSILLTVTNAKLYSRTRSYSCLVSTDDDRRVRLGTRLRFN